MTDASNDDTAVSEDDTLAQDDLDSLAGGGSGAGTGKIIFDESPKEE